MVDEQQVHRHFSRRKIIIPVLIGLLVAGFLVWRDFDELKGGLASLIQRWTFLSTLFIFIALCLVVTRDLAYMYRIRLLTDKKLSWKQSFQVIMMWEFASALTPSVVGGSAVALFIINQEGLSGGKSTAIVMITALLDELFYIICVPLVFVFIGRDQLFKSDFVFHLFGLNISLYHLFFISYGFIVLLIAIIFFAVFIKPIWFKQILTTIFKLKFLRHWQPKVEKLGDDILTTSKEMKGRSLLFWFRAFGSTVCSWVARFTGVNFLIMAVNSGQDNILIYARQLVMWVVLMISPTPGSSGIAEYAFPIFLGEFIPDGVAGALAMLWRLFTYYPYIIAGTIVLPIWLRRVRSKSNTIK